MKLSKSNWILLAIIALLCVLLIVCALRIHAAAQVREQEQARMNSAIAGVRDKMLRVLHAAGLNDPEWFEGALRECQRMLLTVSAQESFVDETKR